VFDADAGGFYALGFMWPPQEGTDTALVLLDSVFHPLRYVVIADPTAISLGIQSNMQLAKAGSALVLCAKPRFGFNGRDTCLLLDPSSGEVSKLATSLPSE